MRYRIVRYDYGEAFGEEFLIQRRGWITNLRWEFMTKGFGKRLKFDTYEEASRWRVRRCGIVGVVP